MEQREKLIELIDAITHNSYPHSVLSEDVDYLIANGVVVLPCRCGECEYCDIGQNYFGQWCICQVKRIDVDPTDFCSYGKLKGGE